MSVRQWLSRQPLRLHPSRFPVQVLTEKIKIFSGVMSLQCDGSGMKLCIIYYLGPIILCVEREWSTNSSLVLCLDVFAPNAGYNF